MTPRGPGEPPRTFSPAVAAGLGAFAGIYSCALTLAPLSMFYAPLLGIAVALVVFKAVAMAELRQRDAASGETPALQQSPLTQRPRVAGLIAFVVCVAVGGGIAYDAKRDIPAGSPGSDDPLVQVGLVFGALIGIPIALGVMYLARKKRG